MLDASSGRSAGRRLPCVVRGPALGTKLSSRVRRVRVLLEKDGMPTLGAATPGVLAVTADVTAASPTACSQTAEHQTVGQRRALRDNAQFVG